jgi:hypothetical protein
MGENEIKVGCWVAVGIDWLLESTKAQKGSELKRFLVSIPILVQ